MRLGSALEGITGCEKGYARTFPSELIHTLLLKIPKVSNILRNSS
jgi:hypothetical protein